MHPFFRQLLVGIGRAGLRAGGRAAESVLEDAAITVDHARAKLGEVIGLGEEPDESGAHEVPVPATRRRRVRR